MVPQSPHKLAGTCIDLEVPEQLHDSKSISGKLLHRLANLSYTSKKQNKKNNNKQWKEKKRGRITMSNSENFLNNPLDHLSTLPRTTLSTRPRLPVQPNLPYPQPQFRSTMQQQDNPMASHTTSLTTCQMSSPMEEHTNIIVNPYSSSQALLMDRNNYCDTNFQEYNSGLQQEYNYASVVNDIGDPSTPFTNRRHIQSPSRFQQQQLRNPALNSNVLHNAHHPIVSPQLARLTHTLRHVNAGNGIYGGSTSSACTASPNKTLLSTLSSASCSPRSDMLRYQNTASILSNSTEMSDLNGSSLIIYQDRNSDDTLPLGTVLYDSSYGDSSSGHHVYCEIPPVPPPPPPVPNNGYQNNGPVSLEKNQFGNPNRLIGFENAQSQEYKDKETFRGNFSFEKDRNDIFMNVNIHQKQHETSSLTPYEEEFKKQNEASSSTSSSKKLNGSPVRRSCQSNNRANCSFSPTKSPRRFVGVENNATKFTNNVIMADTRSPKKKNRLEAMKEENNVVARHEYNTASDDNQANQESQV